MECQMNYKHCTRYVWIIVYRVKYIISYNLFHSLALLQITRRLIYIYRNVS